MGKVFFGGGKVGMEAPCLLPDAFADATWEQIIKACQTRSVPDTWVAGDQKAMTINGTDYMIDIIGKNHDNYADGSGKAPLTFQMHDCYATTYAMNSTNTNVGGWGSCAARTTHLPAIKALMPSVVQNALKKVTKLTGEGNKSSTITTTEDDLFLLSEMEALGTADDSASGEGTQYAYYAAGNSKLKNLNGASYGWWNRSPRLSYATHFRLVSNGAGASSSASNTRGLAFAFCF